MSELPTGITTQRFGRYILLDRIGSGGMAEVFRAVAQGVEGFQRTFVVKRIRPDQSTSPAFVDMFVNEARVSALLNHQNIVQIYDFGEVDGCYFLTMEYLRGKDLSTILRRMYGERRLLDPGIVAFVGREVAQGLAYAHALTLPNGEPLNIVHRDVTPSNIMLLRSGGVKLLDFGVAKIRGDLVHGETTETGVCKGKLPYLSPEQIKGLPLDGRGDIFALGVVLWEALVGRRLFLGKTDFETMKNVIERPIPPPSTMRPEVPTALDFIVIRALERDPARRYTDAKAMADDLERVLQDLRYHSQALPRLLDELFGEDTNEVEVPLAALPLLEGTPAGTPARAGSRSTRRAPEPSPIDLIAESQASSRRGPALWASVAFAAFAGVGAVFSWMGKGAEPARPAAAPKVQAAALAPAEIRVAPPPSPPVMPTSALPPPATAKARAAADAAGERARRREGKSSVRGRIQQGLSIDPFEEARSRARGR